MYKYWAILLLCACRTDESIKTYNDSPAVSIISHTDGAELLEGALVEFRAQVSDSNHATEDLMASWYLDDQMMCDWAIAGEAGTSICLITPQLASSSVIVQVRDPEDAGAMDTVEFTVIPTDAPVAEIISPIASGVYYADQKITFTGLFSDQEDAADELIGHWESDIDGVLGIAISPDSNGSFENAEYLTEGEHFLQLFVEDSTAKSSSDSVTITVGPPNSIPTCEIILPVDGAVGVEGENVRFEAVVNDPDIAEDALVVTWTSDKDGLLGESTPTSSGEVIFNSNLLSVNTHSIALSVTDEVGETCTDLVVYSVGTPPTLSIVQPSNGNIINEGELVIFQANVSDNETIASGLMVSWESSLDGVLSISSADSTGLNQFSSNSLSNGVHSLTVTVTDGDGLTATAISSLVVNGIPSPPSISIIPSSPTTTDNVVASASGSIDPDGQTVTYSYEWSYGSTIIANSTLPFSSTTRHELWTVTVTPSDGITTGTSVVSSVTIVNTVPVLGAVTISPSSNVSTQDMLTCQASAFDPDETLTVNYSWSNQTTGVLLGTGASLSLSPSQVLPNDAVMCTVLVTDSDGASDSVSGTISIVNSAPIISALLISPGTSVSAVELVNCVATANDADGETPSLSYQWLDSVGGLVSNSEQLDLALLSPVTGDTFECIATASDSYGGTDTMSDIVTVSNNAPVISSVSLSPNVVYTDDTIAAIAVVTDSDGDSLTVQYDWYVDGAVVQSSAVDTLAGTYFESNQSVFVIVTATDGMDSGSPLSSSTVLISNTTPSVPSLSLSPNPAEEGVDDLVCTITSPSTDMDSLDVVEYTYEWLDEQGVSAQMTIQTTSLSDVFAGSATVEGMWTCQVIATDGYVTTSVVSATTIVEGCPAGGDGSTGCSSTSCLDILNDGYSTGDGNYWIDPDGGGDFEVYCDMTHHGGGWTLLLMADGDSTYWGNNAPSWSSTGADAAPSGLSNADFHGESYHRLDTTNILLCNTDENHCHDFAHQLNIALYDFFVGNITYTEFSYGSRGYGDVGSSSLLSQYEGEMGYTVSRHSCQWLGINEQLSISSLGYLADGNAGCSNYSGSYHYHDDAALGVGLQSCVDNNSCTNGGSGHKAGRSRSINGIDDFGIIGPWFVFGK